MGSSVREKAEKVPPAEVKEMPDHRQQERRNKR